MSSLFKNRLTEAPQGSSIFVPDLSQNADALSSLRVALTHEFGLVTTDLLSIRGPYKINRSVANPVAKVEPLDPSETRLSLKVARSADLHGQCLDVGQAFQNLSNFAKDLAPLFGSGQATFTPAAEANSLVLTFDPKGLYCEYRLIAESKCPSFQAVQTRLDKIEAVLDRISLQKFDLN